MTSRGLGNEKRTSRAEKSHAIRSKRRHIKKILGGLGVLYGIPLVSL